VAQASSPEVPQRPMSDKVTVGLGIAGMLYGAWTTFNYFYLHNEIRHAQQLGVQAKAWPLTVAEIEDVQEVEYKGRILFRPIYKFQADGVEYRGARLKFSPRLPHHMYTADEAQAFRLQLQLGSRVEIAYFPDNPNINVMLTGDRTLAADWTTAYTGAGIGLLMLVFSWRILKRGWTGSWTKPKLLLQTSTATASKPT